MAARGKVRRARIENPVLRMKQDDEAADRSWKVTLSRSGIGGTQSQRATLRGLGLRKRGSSAVVKDSQPARGRIRTVAHLVAVEEV